MTRLPIYQIRKMGRMVLAGRHRGTQLIGACLLRILVPRKRLRPLDRPERWQHRLAGESQGLDSGDARRLLTGVLHPNRIAALEQ